MEIKLIIAAHKQCELPADAVYLPVQVGKALHPDLSLEGYQPDNEGENISEKNPYYSELFGWGNLARVAVLTPYAKAERRWAA